jgi:hypothetical protein
MTETCKTHLRKLVLIEWYDSHYISGWHREVPNTEPLLCRSVGWIVYDGEEAVTIAAHITEEDDPQRSGEMTIPTRAIVRRVTLEERTDSIPNVLSIGIG